MPVRVWALRSALLGLVSLLQLNAAEAAGALVVVKASYFWKVAPIGNNAELVTLSCRACAPSAQASVSEVPLVSVLRDTLDDHQPETDRLTYLWLLSYQRPNAGRRLLSAVPFFYWRVGEGSATASERDTAPLLDLTALERPVITSVASELLQQFMLDDLVTPVRAGSRAYRTNTLDHERLHLEEAISYLRAATPTDDPAGLTQVQIETLIARLELRKTLLGGFVARGRPADFGREALIGYERTRARNWELLRQWAEKTGLYFESLNLAGTTDQYGILWFAPSASSKPTGTQLGAIWKLLNIKDPWDDERYLAWSGVTTTRWVDHQGVLLSTPSSDAREVRMFPLSVYSLDYLTQPLLLVDFRNMLHVRRHEMTQRTITELTSGVIGISHFTNWYYFAGAALYDFIASRHGAAMNQAERIDSYSQFRVRLALDQEVEPALRREMQRRVDSLAVNPLEVSPARELQTAAARYGALENQAGENGRLTRRLDKSRRRELALVAETRRQRLRDEVLHAVSLGAYTHRVSPDADNLATLSRYRRLQHALDFLDVLTRAGTQPEVAYSSEQIRATLAEVQALIPITKSAPLRERAGATLAKLRNLSQDTSVQADCAAAVAMLEHSSQGAVPGVALRPAAIAPPGTRPAIKVGVDPLE